MLRRRVIAGPIAPAAVLIAAPQDGAGGHSGSRTWVPGEVWRFFTQFAGTTPTTPPFQRDLERQPRRGGVDHFRLHRRRCAIRTIHHLHQPLTRTAWREHHV